MADFDGDTTCGPTHHACECFHLQLHEAQGRIAALEVALERAQDRWEKWIGSELAGTHIFVGAMKEAKENRATLTDTGEGRLVDDTPGGPYINPAFGAVLKLSGWLPPDKVQQAQEAVTMIDTVYGSLNAQCKAEAIAALEVEWNG